MTEKRFTTFVENGSVCLNDALKVYKTVDVHYYEYLLKCMNELNNENAQLKKEKEYWKGQCISQSNLNSIYHNELSIAQEQGYAPTNTFKFCFGDLNKHLEKYKKFYNSHSEISERYINAVEDESTDVYQDTETMEILASYEILERLNEQDKTIKELSEENEQLKQAYQTLKSRHGLLHDECLEAECDRDSLKKDVISLEKENEQLKNTVEALTAQLAHGMEDLMSDD